MMQDIAFTGKGKLYFEEQQQQQLEKGVRLLVGASVFLIFLMAVDLMTSEHSLYITKLYFFMLGVTTLSSSIVFWWLAGKIYNDEKWKPLSLLFAGLFSIFWAVLSLVLDHPSHLQTVFLFGEIYILVSVVAFFGYRPALLLAATPIVCSFLIASPSLTPTLIFAYASKLLLALGISEYLNHCFRDVVFLHLDSRNLKHQLKAVGLIDPVTQLHNNRHFNIELDREVMSARRSKLPLSVLVINIQPIRLYTFTCGHEASDDLLRIVSKALEHGAYRPRDFIARMSVDEFALILPETDENGATVVAERIESNIHHSCDLWIERDLHEALLMKSAIVKWEQNMSTKKMLNRIKRVTAEINVYDTE
ncbi:GGDEF domain-containing protein [Photobacterium sanguinicancri]|uniref:diguanylate cyclase n=1 Tax=Photobacterium sanguinicancri TaxID=875932 RepID=A0ABX4FRY6_9GAMM|nr:diguanylate cyclase [Photobacterium sanguinicancri]OZS41662.1 hypothetical protein ASV53_22535 [Photobacterium sanguinicancri]